eukprot:SAG11_NODE_30502_length_300_cov_1.019900_1_plen_20_part_10
MCTVLYLPLGMHTSDPVKDP